MKRSKKIHENQLFNHLMNSDKIDDIDQKMIETLSKNRDIKELYVDPEKSEDYVPFEKIPVQEVQKTYEKIDSLVGVMEKRNMSHVIYDKKFFDIPADHFHSYIICPYQFFFKCDFENTLKDPEKVQTEPDVLLSMKHKQYLVAMSNYKAFQKYIRPIKIDLNLFGLSAAKSCTLRDFSEEVRLKCGNVYVMNITKDGNYFVFCARMDLKNDLIFLALIFLIDSPLPPKIFSKKTLVVPKELKIEDRLSLNDVKVKFCNYFYFACGCEFEN